MLPKFLRDAGYMDEDETAVAIKKKKRTLQSWRQRRIGPAWTYNGQDVIYHKDWILDHLKATKEQPARSGKSTAGLRREQRCSPPSETATS